MELIKKNMFLILAVLGIAAQIGCSGNDDRTVEPDPVQKTPVFQNPRPVSVQGYYGDLMEPSISRDGQILFFNNLNADLLPSGASNETDLHYAMRIDDVTFEYVGEVDGANIDNVPDQNELEGVPSSDKNNRLYFIYTGDYFDDSGPNYLKSIFYGDFSNGGLANVKSIANLGAKRSVNENPVPGEVNFDAEIHYDGEELYFVEGIFSGNSFPDEANIGLATKVNDDFVVHLDSKNLFAKINSDALEYAPSISTNRLEFYFTRATGSVDSGLDFGVYAATRNSISEPWDNVERLDVIIGEITEAPSISFDGKLLYYHQKVNGLYQIYVVERVE
ncbi:MAG: hypothetical protein ACR2MT_14825 [Aurantibacter sp.]